MKLTIKPTEHTFNFAKVTNVDLRICIAHADDDQRREAAYALYQVLQAWADSVREHYPDDVKEVAH